MKKSLEIAAGSVLGLGLLFLVAGRSLGDLTGYFRASAGETVSQLEDHIPEEVHDRKLANELTSVRKEVIERQVQLSQSKTQIAQLREDVSKLENNLAARKRLLSEAFPILQAAEEEQMQQVRFAKADYRLVDFQREIDELMASQESETKQLGIKRHLSNHFHKPFRSLSISKVRLIARCFLFKIRRGCFCHCCNN